MLLKLTESELFQAAMCGVIRRMVSIRQKNNSHIHTKHSDWSTDIDGAAAEVIVAKVLGTFWSPAINTFKKPDVGRYQVRSTNHKKGRLIIRKNDSDDDVFILVVGGYQDWNIIGYISGGSAKKDEFWKKTEDTTNKEGCDAWWISQEVLNPIEQLIHVNGRDK